MTPACRSKPSHRAWGVSGLAAGSASSRVDVQIEGAIETGPPLRGLCAVGWESLNHRHGATLHIGKAALAGARAQMPMHLPQQHAHHGLAQVVAPGQQIPEAVRQRQDPLSNRDIRDDVVHQVRGALGHAPAAAARTEPSALARERDQALGLAPDAPEPGEPASEETAREERRAALS